MAKKSLEKIDRNFAQKKADVKASWQWVSATDRRMTVEGLSWFHENGKAFCRLPLKAEKIVRPEVWELGRAPSSARVRFRTDATCLAIRMENFNCRNMMHFAVTGSDGVFVYEGAPGAMKPWTMASPAIGQTVAEKEIAVNLPKAMREFTIYLPLYAPLKSLEIGVNKGAKLLKPTPYRSSRPVVFYGTSITQGGCSSTAGGDYVSLVGRLLGRDVVNLGFSGNGRGEAEVARLVSEIDAEAFVLDYAANSNADAMRENLQPFIQILRKKHRETPIILVSKIHFYQEGFAQGSGEAAERQRDVILETYLASRQKGDRHIHFVDGWGMLPYAEDLALVDGVHPTNQGFDVMARRFAPQLDYILTR